MFRYARNRCKHERLVRQFDGYQIAYTWIPNYSSYVLSAVTATCSSSVANNGTYFVNPKFPGVLNEKGECLVRVKIPSHGAGQLRLNFINFILVSDIPVNIIRSFEWNNITRYGVVRARFQAQPNRRTGVCETDKFVVTGGSSRDLKICGVNTGQHGTCRARVVEKTVLSIRFYPLVSSPWFSLVRLFRVTIIFNWKNV